MKKPIIIGLMVVFLAVNFVIAVDVLGFYSYPIVICWCTEPFENEWCNIGQCTAAYPIFCADGTCLYWDGEEQEWRYEYTSCGEDEECYNQNRGRAECSLDCPYN